MRESGNTRALDVCLAYILLTEPSAQAFPRHSLSRAALVTTGAPIFLLDAFTALLVYYIAAAPPHLPFPPPQQSRLRAALNAARQGRRVTPSIAMMRGGVDDVSAFTEVPRLSMALFYNQQFLMLSFLFQLCSAINNGAPVLLNVLSENQLAVITHDV